MIHKAIENNKEYVVKPQKEGGGNNFYDEEAAKHLKTFIDPATPHKVRESLKQYIVMERIHPPTTKTWMLRNGEVNTVESMSETGLFSLLFIDSSQPAAS